MTSRAWKYGSCTGSSWGSSCRSSRPSSGSSPGPSLLPLPSPPHTRRADVESRFPFYYEVKTLVILWLTLPQIQVSPPPPPPPISASLTLSTPQGSTYIYVAHVHPFFLAHEDDIDAALLDAQIRAKQVGLDYLRRALSKLRTAVVGSISSAAVAEEVEGEGQGEKEEVGGLYGLAGNVLRNYGPAALAAGSALLHPMNGRAPSVRRPSADARGTGQEDLGISSSRIPNPNSSRPRDRTTSYQPQSSRPLHPNFPPSSSSGSSSTSSSPNYPINAPSQFSRSVSAGNFPSTSRDQGSNTGKIDRSLYGFEPIDKTELQDWPAVRNVAMDKREEQSGGGRGGGGWWPWSPREGYEEVPREESQGTRGGKKDQ
jgi:receptor expression-enhancing protein 1/2/3/4